jgi:hypothetical protein
MHTIEELMETIEANIGLRNKNIGNKEKKTVLFGLGKSLAAKIDHITKQNMKIHFLCDNDPKHHGKTLYDIPVISVEDLSKLNDVFAWVIPDTDAFIREIKEQLTALDIEHAYYNVYAHELFGRKEQILELFDLLEDRFSKDILATLLMYRLQGNYYTSPYDEAIFTEKQYFCLPYFRGINPQEVFVDLGGYCGDTLENYVQSRIGGFKKAYIFEPSNDLFETINHRVNRIKKEWNLSDDQITCVQAAVGDVTQIKSFVNAVFSPAANRLLDEDPINTDPDRFTPANEVQVYALDDFFKGGGDGLGKCEFH